MPANKILAREVRERCTGRVDEQVMYCMEALAETHGLLEKRMDEMEKQMIAFLETLNAMVDNATNIAEVVHKFDRQRIPSDDGAPVTK